MINLDPGEHIVYEVRKHWFIFLAHGIFLFLAGIVPFFAYAIVVKSIPFSLPSNGTISGLLVFLYAIWLLFLWISFFLQWTNYYLDVWYVTEKRIIDVEQKRMFHRSVSSLRFDKIQDISIEVGGFISTYFDIGDIRVQTAAENSADFFMRKAASPEKFRNLIFSRHNQESEKSQMVEIVKSHDGTS
jgi:hypothetical protein